MRIFQPAHCNNGLLYPPCNTCFPPKHEGSIFPNRYDGATEEAIVRCARVALGLDPHSTTHLVWKSGDIVNFSEDIPQGAILHLDVAVPRDDVSVFNTSEGIHKRIAVPRRSCSESEPPSIERSSSSEDERRPLLRPRPRAITWGFAPVGSTDSTSSTYDEELANAEGRGQQQRGSILKLKRILAHLANERTFLAWTRVSGKTFTAGILSLTLAAQTSGIYAACFALLGFVYFALGPYVVFVGLERWAEVRGGTAQMH